MVLKNLKSKKNYNIWLNNQSIRLQPIIELFKIIEMSPLLTWLVLL